MAGWSSNQDVGRNPRFFCSDSGYLRTDRSALKPSARIVRDEAEVGPPTFILLLT